MCCGVFWGAKIKMAASLCSSSLVPLLVFWLAIAVETRPSAKRDDVQVCEDHHLHHHHHLYHIPIPS